MKIKTLLFGAGPGAIVFMQNTGVQREFVGFLDNDKLKQGTEYQGLIIHDPTSIDSLQFDEIVITTQWAMAVQSQLIEQLGVEPHKVILPEKNKLKNIEPFGNPYSLKLGRNIIKQLSSLAIARKVPLVVDFGTLLGLTREQDIIPWDDDIDFSAPVEFADEVEQLMQVFVESNQDSVEWIMSKVIDKHNQVTGMWFKFNDPNNKMIKFTTSLCFRQKKDGKSLHMPSLGMWFSPEKHFNATEIIQWQGVDIPVPFAHEEYLTFQYGDWRTPKKNIQLSDYANLQQVEFAEIKAAGFIAQPIFKIA